MHNRMWIMGTVLVLAFSAPVLAEARDAAGGAGNIVSGGGLAIGPSRSSSSGQSDLSISAQGRANTNGPNATDRDLGRDRAEDRENQLAQNHKPVAKSRKHTSVKSSANTNGPSSSDRDFGRDRAEDRRR
jgi:hypothetical protein